MVFDEEEAGSNEGGMLRWLITYADLITLLLAFFIILYALNRTQQLHLSMVARALAKEFNAKSVVGQSPGPSVVTGQSGALASANVEMQSLTRLQHALQMAVNQEGLQKSVTIQSDFRGVEMRLSATMLFPSGSARVSPKGTALLGAVGKALLAVPNPVVVSGYTDSQPIHTALFASNWQLSAVRAANVVSTLAKVAGLPPRLSIAAFGKYRPIASNHTAAGRARNRRVTILVERNVVARLTSGQLGP